ncbi:c2h2 type zinc finger domain protein [Lasius niger]|uniref:C2h2 type zinc finger domain protein n=1 Tax=Lasius niger TaxID=67767 RepID=A0A0J7JST1_LASNI|nr:c2h2 type zinc finger domain protein [Lasius niger]
MQYSCFVQGCPRKCLTPQKRRMHMIDKHTYPKNFFFAVTKEGIDGRRSLLVESGHHPRRSSTVAQSNDSRYWASTPKASQAGETPGPSLSDTGNSEPKPDQQGAVDSDMADLTGAMSALRFVPSSVRFGRGRAGFARR